MTKLLQKLSAAVLLLLPVFCSKAQTYTHGDITAVTMAFSNHDSTMCQSICNVSYDITIASSFVGDSVKVIDTPSGIVIFSAGNTTGASPWHISSPVSVWLFNSVVTDDMLSGSMALFMEQPTKIISGPDTILVHDIFPLYVSNPCAYDTISGHVYVDNNSDCAFNTGDAALNMMEVQSTNNLSSPSVSTNFRYTWSDVSGYYNMKIQKSWMINYDVKLPPQYYFIYSLPSCFPGSYMYSTLPHGGTDFPVHCDSVDVMSYTGYPPAIKYVRSFFMEPYVANTGCDTASGTLTFIKDSRTTYNPSMSIYPATSVSGDTLRWTYTNLTNLTGSGYWNSLLSHICLYPDTSAHIGDTLCFRIYSDIPTLDIDHSNNDQTICLPVIAAYDPNVKDVRPQGTGAPGYIPATTPKLTYDIHFQNTGTAPAMNVTVIDTLDANVDPSTLKITERSHLMMPEWLAPNVAKFYFEGINLPDSAADEANSHGSVGYAVKLRPGLAPGTQIKNRASIYFDSNPPIVTSSTLNTIAAPTAVPVPVVNKVRVYPNPSSDIVYVDGLENGTIYVMDISGAILINQHSSAAHTMVDISHLPNGVYIIRTQGGDNITTTKLIKL